MTICQFYLKGTCKFGKTCRNEHPIPNPGPAAANRNWSVRNPNVMIPSTLFSIETMTKDFTHHADKPLWPLSSYGPAKCEPTFITNLDESPEELRVRAITGLRSGAVNDYLKYESDKILAADQTFSNALSQIGDAYNQAASISSSSGAPNAFAMGGLSNTSGLASSNTFGSSAFGGSPQKLTLGQPSAYGAYANPAKTSSFGTSTFGKSSFGQSQFGQSSFGRPSFGQTSLGQTAPTNSGFGQTAATTSTFGQPTTSTSAFGQPASTTSAFGQNTTTTSAFGQPPTTTSAYGQPIATTSAFGQQSGTTSVFGHSQPQPSSFIKPASGAFTSSGGFDRAQSAFNSGNTGGGFSPFTGQPSGFGASAPAPSSNTTFAQTSFGGTAPPASGFTTDMSMQQGQAFVGAPDSTSALGPAGTSVPPFTANNEPQVAPTGAFGMPQGGVPPQGGSVFGPGSTGFFGNASQPTGQPTSTFGITQMAPAASPFASSTGAVFGGSRPAQAEPAQGTAFDKYDKMLPPDDEYMKMLPESARKAFQADAFEYGNVPDWIPPKAVR